MKLKPDDILKGWMEREKRAVDYGRLCDKRIAELEAYIVRMDSIFQEAQAREKQAQRELEETKKRYEHFEETRRSLEQDLEEARTRADNLAAQVQQLRSKLAPYETLRKEYGTKGETVKNRLVKLETVVEKGKIALEEELRLIQKPVKDLDDCILVEDGEDLIPARWFHFKAALQELDTDNATPMVSMTSIGEA